MRIMYQEEAKIGGELTPLKIIFQKLGGGGGGAGAPLKLAGWKPHGWKLLKVHRTAALSYSWLASSEELF